MRRGFLLAVVIGAALALPSVATADGGFTNGSFSFGTTNRPGDTVIVTFTVSGQPMYDAAVGLNGPFGGTVTSVSDTQNDCGGQQFENNSEWPSYDGMWGAQCTFYPVLQPGDTYTIKLVTSDTYGGSTVLLNNVDINGGSPPPPPPPKNPLPDPTKTQQKLDAQKDMQDALDAAKAPCAQSAVGATAGVWSTTVPGAGLLAGPPAVLIGATAGSRCAALINRAYRDAQIVNDPPAKDFRRLAYPAPAGRAAALPSCARFKHSAHAFCAKLRPLVSKYVAATEQVASIDAALLQTVDAESGAAKADDATTLAKQDAQGQQLEQQFSTAVATEQKLGEKIAGVIRAHHVKGKLSKHQVAKGIAHVEQALEQQGLAAATIQQLAGTALTPSALNLLTATR